MISQGENANEKGGMALHTKILLGLIVGAGAGVSANLLIGGDNAQLKWVVSHLTEPVGQVFLRMLIMIVIPLVFASLALGVAGLGDLRKLGRIGVKTLLYFLLVTALAVTIGLVLVNTIQPGKGLPPDVVTKLQQTYAGETSTRLEQAKGVSFGIQTFVNIVPRNPVKAAADMDMLAVIFFSLIFGVALTLISSQRAAPMLSFLEALGDVTIVIIDLVMKLAPYGVAALIFSVTARFGYDLLAKLGLYVMTVLLGLAIHQFGVFSVLVRVFAGLNPIRFFRRVQTIMITAFSTSSSSATLPTTMRVTEEKLGVPKEICGFVLPLGATMNMNGTALFEGVTTLFIAQVFGIELGLGAQIIVIIMSVLTAVGTAGVPSGSIPLLILVLQTVGVPGEGIAIILGVDRILDMCRTVLNVTGDVTCAAFIARSEGVLPVDRSIQPASAAAQAD
jgi:DAACS family dicarboxylate/amino acid:cation (Na+ or H+) symporter